MNIHFITRPDSKYDSKHATKITPVRGMVSCIIPAFNEHDNLAVLLPELCALLEQWCDAWEIIVIDDGSADKTPELMTHWARIDGVRYVQLSRNFGKEAAIAAGLEAADGDAVICLDADMQHPLALIPNMLMRWQAGVEMVYAVRSDRDDEPWIKRVGTRLFYHLLADTRGVEVPPNAGDFRLMDRKVVDALLALPERTRFMKGLYAWVGFRSEAMPYLPEQRRHGVSHYHFFRLLGLAMTGITAFTTWPLRLVGIAGATFAALSFMYGLYLVGDYLFDGSAPSGWTTIVTALLFFAGVNLISLGMIGEYIGRIFDEVKGRPLYVTRQKRGRSRAKRAKAQAS
ncbi:MAG: glycosyltransferase family 2 protein [Methylobacillus sp.]|jgi:glycosyltransferase involved in cell wall biosynthesis|nr:glycosyltransferase family 2 protein [Methylobacillus sp.]